MGCVCHLQAYENLMWTGAPSPFWSHLKTERTSGSKLGKQSCYRQSSIPFVVMLGQQDSEGHIGWTGNCVWGVGCLHANASSCSMAQAAALAPASKEHLLFAAAVHCGWSPGAADSPGASWLCPSYHLCSLPSSNPAFCNEVSSILASQHLQLYMEGSWHLGNKA